MKLIGITGMSGAGKTTFSDMLENNPDVGVIHVDNIVHDIKEKTYNSFRGHLLKKDRNETKKCEEVRIKPGLKDKIMNNRLFFSMFLKVRTAIINKPILKQIEQLKKEGKAVIVIEDIMLRQYKFCKDLELIIDIKRPYVERKASLIQRDGLKQITKKEIVTRDKIHYAGSKNKKDFEDRTVNIENNKNKEELEQIARDLYVCEFDPQKLTKEVPTQNLETTNKTEQRLYSYFIIKPDGLRFFDKIHEELTNDFDTIRYYKIDDFADIIKKLYFRHYESKGEKFANIFDQYLEASASLYGNKAILAIISNKGGSYQKLREQVFVTKLKLRAEFSSNNVKIVSNSPDKPGANYIKVVDEEGKSIKQKYFTEKGNYRINELNTIHSPDPDFQSTYEELKILLNSDIIKEENMISQKSFEEVQRFNTLHGFRHDREEIKPAISRFVKRDIEDNIEI